MQETKTLEISQRLFLLIAGFIVVVAIFMVGEIIYQFQSLPQNAPHEISFDGEGKTYVKPDIATVTLGVHTQASTSQDTVNQNNKAMDQVTKAVEGAGVDAKDIQTTEYNLSPMYNYTDKGSVFNGYSLDQQIEVKIRNFDNINAVLDKASAAGANTVGSLQFTVDDMDKAQTPALQMAIANAKEKADQITSTSGLHILKLVNISENSNPAPVPMYAQGFAAGSVSNSSVAPEVQTGQQEIDASVTLTYQVQ